jgi:hypothetical protein
VLLDCCGPKSKAPETALARRDHLVESLGLPVTDQSRLATSVSSLSPVLDLEDREIGVFKAKAKSAKGAKSAGKDKSKVSGRAGRASGQHTRVVGSMMTYKTWRRSTIMRVAGSATSAMRKPQNLRRVRMMKHENSPPPPPPLHPPPLPTAPL